MDSQWTDLFRIFNVKYGLPHEAATRGEKKSRVPKNRLKKWVRWVFPRPAWYFPCLWRPSCGCHTCVTRHKHNFNTSGLQEVHLETFFEVDNRQGVVCYLFPGRRSKEGEEDASLQVIAFHSYEEGDFVLKKRKTFSFSPRGILRLFHSQEKEDFDFYIFKKRKTSFHPRGGLCYIWSLIQAGCTPFRIPGFKNSSGVLWKITKSCKGTTTLLMFLFNQA